MLEQDIISRIVDGDTCLFQNLFQRYQDRIYTLCRYLLENPQDAEDAAQETFIKAYQRIASYRPTASFYSWLYRIAVNTCLDQRRRFSLHSLFFPADTTDQIEIFPSNAPSPETAYASQEALHHLQAALRRLSQKLRVIIVLKELEGLSYEEIAEILDISIGTVKSRISRAREELQKNMEKIRNKDRSGSFLR